MEGIEDIFFNKKENKQFLEELLLDEVEFNLYFVYNFLTHTDEQEIIANLKRELIFWHIEKLEAIDSENYEYCNNINLMLDNLIERFKEAFVGRTEFKVISISRFITDLENQIAETCELTKRHK